MFCGPSSYLCSVAVFIFLTAGPDRGHSACFPDQFTCRLTRACIPAKYVCNRLPECADKSDEENCGCKASQVTCQASGRCVDSSKVCDNMVDCEDGTDEKNCKRSPSQNVTKCWQCSNYGAQGTYFDQCPKNGPVDPPRAYIGDCPGKCFTHNDDLNPKLVTRGCTSTQWGLPTPLPPDGCYKWYSEVWCVCSYPGCNGAMLGNLTSNKEFDAHITTTQSSYYFNDATRVQLVGLSLMAVVCVSLTVIYYDIMYQI